MLDRASFLSLPVWAVPSSSYATLALVKCKAFPIPIGVNGFFSLPLNTLVGIDFNVHSSYCSDLVEISHPVTGWKKAVVFFFLMVALLRRQRCCVVS